ncbi:hypothetical protein [Sphingopyxis solisilvae]|uniref:hypothetical protein n=1 Tax=Sphingopyxis solisilvae TaxID=1886788 RepID=UPI001892B58C|nr:hypothetical protein [Sphingopyxis solisilvae]
MSVKSFLADTFGITQLRESHEALGAGKFWTLMGATLAYLVIGIALMVSAVWPGDCDHSGRRLTGLVKKYNCSPDLLSGGTVEIGLFVWLWSMPTIVVVAVAWSWIHHFRRKRARTTQWSK